MTSRKCEDCGQKEKNWGIPAAPGMPGTRRWCRDCAVAHPGAAVLYKKLCELCRKGNPTHGEDDGKNIKRWCQPCGEGRGAVNCGKKCEDCKVVAPSYSLPGKTAKRWCRDCAVAGNYGAVGSGKRCEDCGEKTANFRLASETKVRW